MRVSVAPWRSAVALAAALALAACSGGKGGSSSENAAAGGAVAERAVAAPPSPAEAARFLTQATFGPSEASVAALRTGDYAAWLDAQFALPATSHLAHMDARLVQLRATNANATLSANQFYESFWLQAATGEDQLRQRVKFALSQIFVVSLADPNIDPRGAASYYDTLGQHAFGNYRQLLEAVTLHPMMGVYLTYRGNQKENTATGRLPDENYAREVMQLMSIGVNQLNADGTVRADANGRAIPTYTSADIAGLAKVFTGYSWYHPTPTNSTFGGGSRHADAYVLPMIPYANYHSTSAKSFLGTTIPASTTVDTAGDLRVALDRLAADPNTGPFMSRQLIQRLVTSNPSPAYVSRVAAVWANNGAGVRGDLKAVVRAILLDPEARDAAPAAQPHAGKLREPVIRMTNWMRAFGATSQSGNWLITSTSANTSLGQSPLTSPSVFNFWRPGYSPPSTRMGAQGLVAPEFQGVEEVSVAGYVNTMQNTVNGGIGSTPPGGSGADVRAAYAAEIAVANDPAALVERMNTLLLYGQMSPTLRSRVVTAVQSVAVPAATATNQAQVTAALTNRAKLAVLLTMASPEYLIQR